MISNTQTTQLTNITKQNFVDDDLQRLIVIGNDDIMYRYPNTWKVIPCVSELYHPKGNVMIPAPHNINFDFSKLIVAKLQIIANAYLLKPTSSMKKNEVIELIKKRMMLVTNMPSYNATEYDNFVASLSIHQRGIKEIKLSNDIIANPLQASLLNSYNGLTTNEPIDIKNTKLAKFAYTLATKIRKQYFKLLGVASIRTELCNNQEDMVSFDSLCDIPYGEVYTFEQCNAYYGFSIDSFANYIKQKKMINPYTRQAFNVSSVVNGKNIMNKSILDNFNRIMLFYKFVTGKTIASYSSEYVNRRVEYMTTYGRPLIIDYKSKDYQIHDELLCYIRKIGSDYDNTVFGEINHIMQHTVNPQNVPINRGYKNIINYLNNIQKFVRNSSVLLNNIFDLVMVDIAIKPLNKNYIYSAEKWGFKQNIQMNKGINFLRVVKKTQLFGLNVVLSNYCTAFGIQTNCHRIPLSELEIPNGPPKPYMNDLHRMIVYIYGIIHNIMLIIDNGVDPITNVINHSENVPTLINLVKPSKSTNPEIPVTPFNSCLEYIKSKIVESMV